MIKVLIKQHMRQGRQYLAKFFIRKRATSELKKYRENKGVENKMFWDFVCFEKFSLGNMHLGNLLMHEICLLFIDEFYLTLDASSGVSFQGTDFCLVSWACYFWKKDAFRLTWWNKLWMMNFIFTPTTYFSLNTPVV